MNAGDGLGDRRVRANIARTGASQQDREYAALGFFPPVGLHVKSEPGQG
jgi:hypothetical protein